MKCRGCDTPIPPSKAGPPRKWCSEKCRRDTLYGGRCIECGARTSGSEGPGKAAKRCPTHANQPLPADEKRLRNAARMRRYRRNGSRAAVDAIKRYRVRNPEKRNAWTVLNRALVAGFLTKPRRCESCGKEGRLHGHHVDYSKPLQVVWLCPLCHRAEHPSGGSA